MASLEGLGLRQSDLRTRRSGDAPGCPGVTVDYPGLLSRRARNGADGELARLRDGGRG